MLIYKNVYINSTHNLWKFGGDTVLQTWMIVDCVWKYPKKSDKIKGRSIIYSHIWHIDISKYAYQLDTHSKKVCWRYVLPNTNTVHFCDIFFRHKCPKNSLECHKRYFSEILKLYFRLNTKKHHKSSEESQDRERERKYYLLCYSNNITTS